MIEDCGVAFLTNIEAAFQALESNSSNYDSQSWAKTLIYGAQNGL
jgi:hypothetical protein